MRHSLSLPREQLALGLGLGLSLLGLAHPASAQVKDVKFSNPVRIKAGDRFLGQGRWFPSPAFHDVDRDGHVDLVIADLMGRVTWARREAPGAVVRFAAERPMRTRDGSSLRFNNW